MTLAAGTPIGPYEVVAPLGAGGMGEVYRARDRKLQRDVALKVLPPDFATDADRVARFKREAQLLAALNHPNVAAIFGVEEAGARQALVLELVEGLTLADVLRNGRIAPDDALSIARQIAEALDAAHTVGIVHRDLKPANIKIRPDGTVKVLDFGLAKAALPAVDSSAHVTASPTVTSPALTAQGVILGTAAYMSPEQAKGRAADRLSDVWSFGVVLYEMLAGVRPFNGDGVTDTLASVLRAEPDWGALPSETPAGLRRVLRRCLQRDPRRRWQHIGDVRLELADIESGADVAPPRVVHVARTSRAALLAVAALASVSGVAAGLWFAPREGARREEPVAFALTLPPGDHLASSTRSFNVSNNGRLIAFAAVRNGVQQLFLRSLDRPDAVAVAGSANATYPVFAPDDSAIAFIADGSVKRVSTAGGAPITVASVSAARGLAWAPGDRLVFAASASSGLSIVPASGGAPETLTELDVGRGETNHRWPVVLPDGSGVLFASHRRSRTELDIDAVSFATRARTPVHTGGFPVQVLSSGRLVYSAVNGDTFVAPFDVSKRVVTGTPVPIAERPSYAGVPGFSSIALSPGGTMVSLPFQEPARTLEVVGRDGRSRVLEEPPRNYQQLSISADGRRIAVVVKSGLAEWDIWTSDAPGAPLRRLTVSRFNLWPIWDSDRLTYSSFENGTWRLMSRDVARNEPASELWSGLPQEPQVIGRLPDGKLAYLLVLPQQDLHVIDNGQSRMVPVEQAGPFERALHGLSSDGHWLAYVSNQSGRRETYITSLAERGVTRQVTRDGGESAVWSKTGADLFYFVSRPGESARIARVTVSRDGGVSPPTTVATGGSYVIDKGSFDVFPDGSLLVMRDLPGSPLSLHVVVNWSASRGFTATSP